MKLPGVGKAVEVNLSLNPETTSARATAAELVVGERVFGEPVLACTRFRLDEERVGCEGTLRFNASWGATEGTVRWTYEFEEERLSLSGQSGLFGGEVSFSASLDEDGLSGDYTLSDLAVESLAAPLLDGYSLHGGTLSGHGTIRRPESSETTSATAEMTLTGLGFDNADGTVAGAELGLTLSASGEIGDKAVTFEVDLAPSGGEALFGSLYLNFAQARPRLQLAGNLAGEVLAVESAELTDGELLSLSLSGEGNLSSLAAGRWTVELDHLLFPEVYDRYLANLVQALGLGRFDLAGKVRGRMELAEAELAHATLDIRSVDVRDSAGRFAFEALDGLVDYSAEGDSVDSALAWDRAGIYQVEIAPGEARFFLAANEFQLLQPLRLGIFDGAATIRTLAFSDYGSAEMTLDFEADIEPISLRPVTEALEWPPLNGTLSGEIPRVRLRDEIVEVGGAIELAVFDGTVRFEKLRLERLFGVLPTLAGDLILTNLDLRQMTGAFSFGEIRGRVEGGLRNLRLLDWQPVAFDMTLKTPENDRSTHRISQRAVDNLTSIGGGPTAVLSSTFLRFFEDFGYERLGIACRLRNNVCSMAGVRPAPDGGYYIVEGSGIPRIDVIGYSREVDFQQLIRRVKAATEAGSPTFN